MIKRLRFLNFHFLSGFVLQHRFISSSEDRDDARVKAPKQVSVSTEKFDFVASTVAALKECMNSRDIASGKEIHSQVINSGIRNIFVDSTLVDMYAKCGDMVLSRSVFDNMIQRNAVSWNCLIRGYVENEDPELALELFDVMRTVCIPTARTYAAALTACANLGARRDQRRAEWLEKGRAIHSKAVINRCCDSFVKTMLVNMYSKCGSMAEAQIIFDNITPQRTVVCWTALIQGYVESGQSRLALKLFDQMDKGQPNGRTFVVALTACAALAIGGEGNESSLWLQKARELHSQAIANRSCDLFVENTLVNLYARCGHLDQARSIFNSMPRRNVVTWNALLQGFVDNGKSERALELFDGMMEEESCVANARSYVAALTACARLAFEEDIGVKIISRWLDKGRSIHSRALISKCYNIFVENTLIDMYAKCRSMEDAKRVFDEMIVQDLVSWNCLIRGYVHNGENRMVLEMISSMESRGFDPNSATFVAALMACGNLVAIESGIRLHAEIKARQLQDDVCIATCLVDFYGRCGSMEIAKQVFDAIASKDVWAFNALLSGFSQQGDTDQVFRVFQMMVKEKGVRPNAVSLTHVLAACSHGGLVEEAEAVLESMNRRYGVRPDLVHYTCVVDGLARANRLEEAVEFVRRMPVKASAVTWTSLLSAARKWNNLVVGRVAYHALLGCAEKDGTAYTLMANMLNSNHRFTQQKYVKIQV